MCRHEFCSFHPTRQCAMKMRAQLPHWFAVLAFLQSVFCFSVRIQEPMWKGYEPLDEVVVEWRNAPSHTTRLTLFLATHFDLAKADFKRKVAVDIPSEASHRAFIIPEGLNSSNPYWIVMQSDDQLLSAARYGAFRIINVGILESEIGHMYVIS
ncbi:hypothetical protein EC973_009307 [Apophysomyces ossiformis]|uniref:Uncharacterized protein n=1 Tax=Apophysomyces ossiformis TaxID=679940 RepID=A0A8H7ESK7_9FUNG|nr:hypothetical protein EC973_009307 [Apophysomyces ossiformis]